MTTGQLLMLLYAGSLTAVAALVVVGGWIVDRFRGYDPYRRQRDVNAALQRAHDNGPAAFDAHRTVSTDPAKETM